MADQETLLKILDLARWAPSGDNTQPWRFEVISDDQIAVHGHDTREWCIYDFDGHASHMAHGALLETLRIAATRFGLCARWVIREGLPDAQPVYDVFLRPSPAVEPDPLLPFIENRVVQRRPMSTRPLTDDERRSLAAALGAGHTIQFFDSLHDRMRLARLLWQNAHVRLTCREAFEVHRRIIEWGAHFSKERIPERAVGVDPITARLMKWVMRSWVRVEFFNRFLGGTLLPRLQLDFLPALSCAAHILVRSAQPPAGITGHVRAGIAMQRLWLTATSLGLYLQPEMTPLIFRWYARAERRVSQDPAIERRVLALADALEALSGARREDAFVFLCRIGHSNKPASRSLRLELDELLVRPDALVGNPNWPDHTSLND